LREREQAYKETNGKHGGVVKRKEKDERGKKREERAGGSESRLD